MHVGELAKRTGASIRSLHYYEQMGVPIVERKSVETLPQFDDSTMRCSSSVV
jgi:hypothetical protein